VMNFILLVNNRKQYEFGFDKNIFVLKLLLQLVMKNVLLYIRVKNRVEVQMIIQNDDH
jgi:hypothetical protein